MSEGWLNILKSEAFNNNKEKINNQIFKIKILNEMELKNKNELLDK